MRASRIALRLLALVLFLAAPATAQPDVAYSERHVFTVPAAGRGPLTEDVEVSVTYLTARATSHDAFQVYEQYFNRVSGLEADVDGRRLRRGAIHSAPAQLEDVFLSGGTIHSVTLPDVPRVGQTVTYRFRRTYPDAAYLPLLRVPNVNRLARYEVVVQHPAGVQAAFDVVTPRGAVPHSVVPDATVSRLVFADVPYAAEVPLIAAEDAHAVVQLRLTAGPTALTPTAPDAFAAWYGALVGRVDTTATPRLRALAETLRRDTPRATIAAIHDHVRGGIRYVADSRGESAFVPRAPDLVLEHAYGDCKDRAWLVATLARILGHRVDLVLTSTVASPPVPHVSLDLYNHVVCAFDDGAERIVFDPTHPYLPFGALPEALVGARSLWLGVDGAQDVPIAAQDSLPALDVSAQLDLDQPARSPATVVVRGAALGAVREARARGTATDAANAVSALAGRAIYRTRLSQIVLIDEADDALTFRATADLSQFVVASPTRRYLPLTPFPAIPNDAPSRRADALPIDVPDRPNVRLRLDLAPDPWTLAPAEVAWGEAGAAFTVRVDRTPDLQTVTYRFEQRTRHFAGAARDAYLDLADRYLGARREVLTFTRPTE